MSDVLTEEDRERAHSLSLDYRRYDLALEVVKYGKEIEAIRDALAAALKERDDEVERTKVWRDRANTTFDTSKDGLAARFNEALNLLVRCENTLTVCPILQGMGGRVAPDSCVEMDKTLSLVRSFLERELRRQERQCGSGGEHLGSPRDGGSADGLQPNRDEKP